MEFAQTGSNEEDSHEDHKMWLKGPEKASK